MWFLKKKYFFKSTGKRSTFDIFSDFHILCCCIFSYFHIFLHSWNFILSYFQIFRFFQIFIFWSILHNFTCSNHKFSDYWISKWNSCIVVLLFTNLIVHLTIWWSWHLLTQAFTSIWLCSFRVYAFCMLEFQGFLFARGVIKCKTCIISFMWDEWFLDFLIVWDVSTILAI